MSTIDERTIQQYDEVTKNMRADIYDLLALETYNEYSRELPVSFKSILPICNLAKKCWEKSKEKDKYKINNNSKPGVADYVVYLLNNMCLEKIQLEELMQINVDDIIDCCRKGVGLNDLLIYDTSSLEYSFTDYNENKYYRGVENGFYIVSKDKRLLKKPEKVDNDLQTIFDLLNNDAIIDISFNTHYHIRKMIKEKILLDNDLKEHYSKAIKKYKSYCINRCITSEDILNSISEAYQKENLSLTKIDCVYTDENKLKRLKRQFKKVFKMFSDKTFNDYTYVASLNNGTDYYYNGKNYVSIDSNDKVERSTYDNKFFWAKETNYKDSKFMYLSKEEVERIYEELGDSYNKDQDMANYIYSGVLSEIGDYVFDKKLELSKNSILDFNISIRQTFKEQEMIMQKKRQNALKRYKEYNKEINNSNNKPKIISGNAEKQL